MVVPSKIIAKEKQIARTNKNNHTQLIPNTLVSLQA